MGRLNKPEDPRKHPQSRIRQPVPYTMLSAWMIYNGYSNLLIARGLGMKTGRTNIQRWRKGQKMLPVFAMLLHMVWPETALFIRRDGRHKVYSSPVTYRPPSTSIS